MEIKSKRRFTLSMGFPEISNSSRLTRSPIDYGKYFSLLFFNDNLFNY